MKKRATVDISFPMLTITATFRRCSSVGPWPHVEDGKETFSSILSKGCLVGAKRGGQRGDSSSWLWLRVGWTGDSMKFAEAAFWEAFPRVRLHMFSITADHQTRWARRASSAHADVCTLGMSAVSPLLQGSVSAVEAHWLPHNILFGQITSEVHTALRETTPISHWILASPDVICLLVPSCFYLDSACFRSCSCRNSLNNWTYNKQVF